MALSLLARILLVHVVTVAAIPVGEQVPVKGFAMTFIDGKPIVGAKVSVLERPDLDDLVTDDQGRFSFTGQIGTNVTALLEHEHIHPTQTGTVAIPWGGIVLPQHQLCIQAPRKITYDFLDLIVPRRVRTRGTCQLVVTVAAFNKTAHSSRQGEAGATVSLAPDYGVKPDYFGIFKDGKTDPVVKHLNSTSQDGGVLWVNAPLGEYVIQAHKAGVEWGPATVLRCIFEGTLVNAAPPWGPAVVAQ